MKPDIDPHILQTVKSILTRHIGSGSRISYDELTEYVYGKPTENNKRKLRAVIAALNADPDNRVVICSDRTDGGVFVNGHTDEDMEKHARFIGEEESQALTTLHKLSAMKHKLNELYGSELLRPVDAGQGRLF